MFPVLNENGQIIGISPVRINGFEGEELPRDYNMGLQLYEAPFYLDGKYTKQIITEIKDFKKLINDMIKRQCIIKAEEIFPSYKRMNIIVGATDNYPEYLKGDKGIRNIAIFTKVWQNLVTDTEALLNASVTVEDTYAKYEAVVWPTEESIFELLEK